VFTSNGREAKGRKGRGEGEEEGMRIRHCMFVQPWREIDTYMTKSSEFMYTLKR